MSLSGLSVTASFQYDAVGRRQSKTINGTPTHFLYDGLNVIQELTGGIPTANLLTGLGIDETLLRIDAAGPRSFLTGPGNRGRCGIRGIAELESWRNEGHGMGVRFFLDIPAYR